MQNALHFRSGRLISYDYVTEPFAFYGKIFNFWNDLGGLVGGLGHPLADPQFLPDGTTCIVRRKEDAHINVIGRNKYAFRELSTSFK